jgi:hypothetical protein
VKGNVAEKAVSLPTMTGRLVERRRRRRRRMHHATIISVNKARLRNQKWLL